MAFLRRRGGLALLVALGGALGTTVRAVLESAYGAAVDAWPWTTFVINVVGAFVLGALLEVLLRSGPDEGWLRAVRLGCGTGVLGGFTTYSTFVLEIDQRARDGHLALAAGYALASVVVGLLAAAAGIVAAGAVMRRRRRPA